MFNMDGNRLSEQTLYSCRLCFQQFAYYNECAFHERMHLEQISLQGGLRPSYDNHIATSYTSTGTTAGTLDSFDKLIQPLRGGLSESDIRSQSESRTMSGQADIRHYIPSSLADARNLMVTSPIDNHNLLPSSPAADLRNMVPSSPADHRNLVPSSPADTRNLGVSSPGDPRNMVPASPVDPRNMVPASPVDQRNLVPASPRSMIPASPVDPRNVVPASPVDPRNMIPASPVDHRNLVPASPASIPDKHSYRGDIEGIGINLGSRSTPINPQSPTVSMAITSMSSDVRIMPGDTRSQLENSRHLPVESQSLSYSSSSFLDSLTHGVYTQDLPSKPLPAASFTAHPIGRVEDLLGLDNRPHTVQKPDPYYGIPKSHYAQSSDREGYTNTQYSLSKPFGPAQTYYQQGLQNKPPPVYGADTPSTSSLNFYSHTSLPENSSIEHREVAPKQTLHYGPSGLSTLLSNHSHYQSSIPNSEPQLNSIQSRVQPGLDQLRGYQRSPASPNPTYSQSYRGSQTQNQVYAPVPSHALPSQHDYKLSTEPVLPSVNLALKSVSSGPNPAVKPAPSGSVQPGNTVRKPGQQDITCYLCSAPFSNMADMSEHMKMHAQGIVAQNRNSQFTSSLPSQQNFNPINGSGASPQSSVSSLPSYCIDNINNTSSVREKDSLPLSCTVCGKNFPKQAMLLEHMKWHNSPQQHECKICGKVFKKKSKCSRHEALHSRDIHLYYCEVCDMNFEHKARYLYHVQTKHTEQDATKCHQHREHQAGTKKAVPLTGGSIDTTFDSADLDKYIDCQICDEEIEKEKLLSHLKEHEVQTCDKCDQVFLCKTEYVAHLMSKHRQELVAGKSGEQLTDKNKSLLVNESVNELVVNAEVPDKKEHVKSRREIIKDLKEKKKEVMKNLKEKEKEIKDLEDMKKIKDEKANNNGKVKKINKGEKQKTNPSETKTTTSTSVTQPMFSCSQCKMSFSLKSELIQHTDKHFRDPTRTYCEVCDYSYHAKEKGYYIFHMKYHRDHELIESSKPELLPCQICYTNIPKDTFVTHVKRVHSQYSCDICQWSYSTEKSLVKHMRSIHGGKKYKTYVWDSSHYIENMVEPEPAQKTTEQRKPGESTEPTPVVYKKLKDVKSEQNSREKNLEKSFPCKQCTRSYTKKQYLVRHMKSHSLPKQDDYIVCELCSARLDSRGTYIYHLQHHKHVVHLSVASAENPGIKVDKSQSTGVNSTVMKSEENDRKAVKKEEIKSENDGKKMKSDSIVKKAESIKTENIKADEKCKSDKEIKHETSTNKDPVLSPNKVANENKVKIGNKINESFPVKKIWITVLNPETGDFEEKLIEEKDEPEIVFDIKIFEDNMAKTDDHKQHEIIENEKKVVDVVNEIVYCRLCNKCLKRSTLEEHFKTHLTYSCHLCQYSFTKKQRYIEHQQALHLNDFIEEEIVKFEEAEKSLLEEPELDASSGETGKKDQQDKETQRRKRSSKFMNCALCTSDIRQDKYTAHLKSHEKPVFICQFCEREFCKKNLFLIHEKSHEFVSHGKSELPYPKLCPICCSVLKSRDKFFNHLMEHLGQITYKCEKCESCFSNERNLDNHVRISHDSDVKIFWKPDGEGLTFDSKTGRIHEVNSDYKNEVKELNELCKSYGKPAIWLSATPKKPKDKQTPVSKPKSEEKVMESSESLEESDSDEKPKPETSDEDYVPERTLRKRKLTETDTDSTQSDEEEEEEVVTEEEEDKPVRKKTRSAQKEQKDSSEERNKPRSTKTRHVTAPKKLLLKQKIKQLKRAAGRILRSSLGKKSEEKKDKTKEARIELKRQTKTEVKAGSPKKRRSELENLSFEEVEKVSKTEEFPEKCPVCGIAQFSLSSYEQHCKLHGNNMPFTCPVCKQTFTREVNMLTHIKHRHKDYRLKNQRRKEEKKDEVQRSPKPSQRQSISQESRALRTRNKSPSSTPGTPTACSTPLKGSQPIVKLSPINVEERKKALKTATVQSEEQVSIRKSYNSFMLESIETKDVYVCELCNKKMTTKWNFAQHVQTHKKEQKEKETKPSGNKKESNKKDVKKKDKESKPFSCKDCSESFKKKRDLYIHTKIHSTDDDDNAMETSVVSEQDSVTINPSGNKSASKQNASKSSNKTESIVENSLSKLNSSRKSSDASSDQDKPESVKNGSGSKVDKDIEDVDAGEIKSSDSTLSGMNVDTSVRQEANSEMIVQETEESNKGDSAQKNNGCDITNENSESHNNNEDSRSLDSESDDRTKLLKPSVNKMSMETAVSKWKAKVRELLTSQLELYASKKQEEMDNPEIRRVKNYLSISGKEEKFKFECRICGDANLTEEAIFRSHMDIHLNEPPPHCSICDIYFMAIHPKRRLAEHNRKKHPEIKC